MVNAFDVWLTEVISLYVSAHSKSVINLRSPWSDFFSCLICKEGKLGSAHRVPILLRESPGPGDRRGKAVFLKITPSLFVTTDKCISCRKTGLPWTNDHF